MGTSIARVATAASPALPNRSASGGGRADREAGALVELACGRVKRCSGVPEAPQQLHLAGIVPDVQRDRAARLDDATHLRNHPVRVGHEVQDQPRDGCVELAVAEGEGLSIARFEGGAGGLHLPAGMRQEPVGGVEFRLRVPAACVG